MLVVGGDDDVIVGVFVQASVDDKVTGLRREAL